MLVPRRERVQTLICRRVLNLRLAVGTVTYLLPSEFCLDYQRRISTDQELNYNLIYPTFLLIQAEGELLPILRYQDSSIRSKTVQLNRQ